MLKSLPILVSLLTLTSCLSLPKPTPSGDISFSRSDNEAMITIADLNKAEPVFEFRQVDLQNRKFLGEPVKIYGCITCFFKGNTYVIENEDAYLRMRFLAKKIPPGNYAIVQFTETFDDFGMSRNSKISKIIDSGCLGLAAPVFEIKAGQINFIRFNGIDVMDFDQIHNYMKRLEANLLPYNKITATPRPSPLAATISFMTNDMHPKDCSSSSDNGKSFEILNITQQQAA
ncbi:hypothetical protein [Sneathiella limimaris]|uniref:hypothetical protein n=1 Tax=Sneathiella limimaris TaxID=1964213 RepID=UPI00146CE60B|nr:hypothetical protein [Sneathiella limimaris]